MAGCRCRSPPATPSARPVPRPGRGAWASRRAADLRPTAPSDVEPGNPGAQFRPRGGLLAGRLVVPLDDRPDCPRAGVRTAGRGRFLRGPLRGGRMRGPRRSSFAGARTTRIPRLPTAVPVTCSQSRGMVSSADLRSAARARLGAGPIRGGCRRAARGVARRRGAAPAAAGAAWLPAFSAGRGRGRLPGPARPVRGRADRVGTVGGWHRGRRERTHVHADPARVSRRVPVGVERPREDGRGARRGVQGAHAQGGCGQGFAQRGGGA